MLNGQKKSSRTHLGFFPSLLLLESSTQISKPFLLREAGL